MTCSVRNLWSDHPQRLLSIKPLFFNHPQFPFSVINQSEGYTDARPFDGTLWSHRKYQYWHWLVDLGRGNTGTMESEWRPHFPQKRRAGKWTAAMSYSLHCEKTLWVISNKTCLHQPYFCPLRFNARLEVPHFLTSHPTVRSVLVFSSCWFL